jgi:hypothetical protein
MRFVDKDNLRERLAQGVGTTLVLWLEASQGLPEGAGEKFAFFFLMTIYVFLSG